MSCKSLSSLHPSGKVVRRPRKDKEASQQLSLFVGVSVVDGSGWLQQEIPKC